MAKFKSANPDGGGVTIWRFDAAGEIRVPTDGTYETDDKAQIEVLRGSTMVVEVKESKAKKDDDK